MTWTMQQLTVLRARSAELGISVADLVRRIVDAWIDSGKP